MNIFCTSEYCPSLATFGCECREEYCCNTHRISHQRTEGVHNFRDIKEFSQKILENIDESIISIRSARMMVLIKANEIVNHLTQNLKNSLKALNQMENDLQIVRSSNTFKLSDLNSLKKYSNNAQRIETEMNYKAELFKDQSDRISKEDRIISSYRNLVVKIRESGIEKSEFKTFISNIKQFIIEELRNRHAKPYIKGNILDCDLITPEAGPGFRGIIKVLTQYIKCPLSEMSFYNDKSQLNTIIAVADGPSSSPYKDGYFILRITFEGFP